jgi:hypothetical protein
MRCRATIELVEQTTIPIAQTNDLVAVADRLSFGKVIRHQHSQRAQ